MYFDGALTSESYMKILSGSLVDVLEDEVSLRDLSRMWYQHDGAPAHKFAQPSEDVGLPELIYGTEKKRASNPRKNIALTSKEIESSSSNKISKVILQKWKQ
ncbi:hypothetical protein TNCV_503451 [Trichonephila clavipes]|nr:hypothetical protein TNCV_503451 [Trichonephila clavipes]